MALSTISRLEALASGPKSWLITTTYECGKVRTLRQPREAMARNYAERESLKIGIPMLDRETGRPVRVASVTVEHLPEQALRDEAA